MNGKKYFIHDSLKICIRNKHNSYVVFYIVELGLD